MATSTREKAETVRRNLTKAQRENLFETERFLDRDTRERLGLRVPCTVYVQDPSAADEALTLQEIDVRWEPGLGDGPTSARVAVVDYDADARRLVPPAHWNEKELSFCDPEGRPVAEAPSSPWFRQVNAWATVERVLEFYEDARSLGRRIPWGFDGGRLLVVPQAGFRDNAFYDRHSKSLQLYYFGDREDPRYTCLSHDILAHETGHAILDGIRPQYLEHSSWETSAFHEFVGDLTAILLAFRNNDLRRLIDERFGTALDQAEFLTGIAEEFGQHVTRRPYLRTALNEVTYARAAAMEGAHDASQLLTGAMFDILRRIAAQHLTPERQAGRPKPASGAQALWWTSERIQRTSLQALDLLPPADVRFVDYARAVLRSDELSDPADPHGYRPLMSRVFHERGLCDRPYECCVEEPEGCALTPPRLPTLSAYVDAAELARSRIAAYHFLHDNRRALGIPPEQDFVVTDLYDTSKYGRGIERLPRNLVVQYLWREAVALDGPRFGRFQGESVELLCGGTLVFDDRGNLLSRAVKPGRGTEQGERRRFELLDHVARQVERRRITLAEDPEAAILSGRTAPVVAQRVGGALRLERAPHLCGGEDEEEAWTASF